jgi:sugar lactone lactonase YvrE
MRLTNQTKHLVTALSVLALFTVRVEAGPITATVFATGAPISSTSPDSVVWGDGSLWVSYQNGADSTGASGSSTVVRYSPTGGVVNTWTIAGNVDGLRIDPSGQVWALQNNDGNSALTVINPVTNATTPYTYGSSYTNVANRGFDDAVFSSGQVYLSETNPTSGTDPVIVQLTTGLLSPLQVTGILNSTFTGTNLATGLLASTTITDSDSLILAPNGDLVLTGEADQEIVFVHHPGAANQSESFIMLLGTDGTTISGLPDDTVFPTATNGTFYLADTGANTVYALAATGLPAGSVYVDVGNEFGLLNTNTGVVTPLFTGISPHGVTFVASTPEPGSFFLVGGALLLGVAFVLKSRRGAAAKG